MDASLHHVMFEFLPTSSLHQMQLLVNTIKQWVQSNIQESEFDSISTFEDPIMMSLHNILKDLLMQFYNWHNQKQYDIPLYRFTLMLSVKNGKQLIGDQMIAPFLSRIIGWIRMITMIELIGETKDLSKDAG